MFRKWFEAKLPTIRRLGRTAAAAVLLAGALTGGPAWAMSVERAPAPEGSWSLGAADVYVEIRDLGGKSQSVSIPMSESEVRWLDQGSLRLQWWNPDKKHFELVDGSRYDAGKKATQSTVSKDGRYGVFGWSAWSHIRSVQGQICDPSEILSDQLINELCLVILCPAYDTMAWSEAWFEGTGQRVPPGDVGEHFGNICDQCIGRPAGPVNPAECGGGNPQPQPGQGVPPPELEQIPNGIEKGGRAVAIAVRPGNDDEMIVASETGGLFATEDRGDTWRHASYDTTFNFSDVEYLPSLPDVVVASAHRDTRVLSGGGIWRSADGGGTWTQIPLTPPLTSCVENLGAYALELDSGGSRLWAGTTCGLAYSDDGALTWSFMPAVTGYTHGKVYAVAAPAAGHLKILTDAGVKVTANSGTSWTVSNTGLPVSIGLIGKAVHNQIAVSPRNSSHLYFAFAYWGPNGGRHGLYRSTNNGTSWSAVLDLDGLNRMPFVRVAEPLSGGSNRYDLYFSTGGCLFERTTVTHGTTPTFSPWQELHFDHCDPADLAFSNDGATPLLLASDGGVHKTEDNGLNWTLTGGVRGGYNALQITEAAGQQHDFGDLADLYFATQDNGIWASPDFGRTWPGSACCEGFFLSVPREPLPDDETKVSGVACAGCINFMSGPLLRDFQGFPNAPNWDGNPKLLKPRAYIQSARLPGLDATLYNLTTDNGATWTPRYGFPEPPRSLPQLAGPAGTPTVFTAVKVPGVTPNNQERVGIKRITGVLGSGTPVVSQVSGFGSLGTFPTMFAWYKPFGVDVADPNFFLAPDIVDAVVKKSTDGGMTWAPDTALTQLVTGAGTFRFRWDEFVQTSSFGFDPECPGHILVGTTQAGVLRSFNGGGTWERVSGTERIPHVSSFYFAEDGNAVLSSYGRGLWRLRYTCPNTPRSSGFRAFPDPVIYDRGTIFPLRTIDDPVTCPQCVVLMTRGGEVLEYVLSPEGDVKQVVLSAGSLAAYASDGKEIAVPVEVRFGTSRKLPPDSRLASLLAAGNRVQGLTLEGRSFKGLLVAAEQAGPEDLPVPKILNPYVVVSVPKTHGVGVSRLRTIEIVGHGFDPKVSITLTLDGAPVTVKPVFDDKGVFRVSTPVALAVGGHIVRAEQKVGLTTWRDAYTFNVTVEDEEEEE
jgi:photosystem II stability/assembly factor-like uncharacterized protein